MKISSDIFSVPTASVSVLAESAYSVGLNRGSCVGPGRIVKLVETALVVPGMVVFGLVAPALVAPGPLIWGALRVITR